MNNASDSSSGSSSGSTSSVDEVGAAQRGAGVGASASAMPPPSYGAKLGGMFDSMGGTKVDEEVDILSFITDLPDSENFLRLEEGEGLIEALQRLDPELVTTYSGTRRFFKRKRVPPGHVGLGDNASRTLFFKPGAYTRIGIGRKLPNGAVRRVPGPGERLDHGDVSYVHLRDDQVAVLAMGQEEYIIGKGRYLVRRPNTLLPELVDLRRPGPPEMNTVIRESQEVNASGTLVDRQEVSEEVAGYKCKVGSVVFARAEPGYVWAVQRGDGTVRTGQGVTAIRREESLLCWLSAQRSTRTTAVKTYSTACAERCEIKLQLQWVIVDGSRWVLLCLGSFQDPFDFMEETLDALIQDEIGSHTKDALEAQRLCKFDEFEQAVRPPLADAAAAVGVALLGIEVRHMRFPVSDEVMRERKMLEAEALKAQREREHESALKRQELAQLAEAAEANLAREQNAARRAAEIAAVRDERDLAKVEADARRRKREMESEQEASRINGQTRLLEAENEALVKAVEREKQAEAALRIARLEAEAEIVRAEAAAQAAAKMAQIFKENPEYLKYKQMEMQMQLEQARIAAVAGFADTPNALVPPALQRDVLRINAGYDPHDLLLTTPGAGGVVTGARDARSPPRQ